MDRNEWAKAAIVELRKMFRNHNRKLPRRILVSVGFPSGSISGRTVAECWSADASNGATQIFLSPTVTDPLEALEILTHELIHAHTGNEGGHSHEFQRVAKQLGLVSPWVEAHAGTRLTADLEKIAKKLGKFRNPAFIGGDPSYTGVSQSRLLKVFCKDCDYIVRMTRKQIDRGLPKCGVCDNRLEEAVNCEALVTVSETNYQQLSESS